MRGRPLWMPAVELLATLTLALWWFYRAADPAGLFLLGAIAGMTLAEVLLTLRRDE